MAEKKPAKKKVKGKPTVASRLPRRGVPKTNRQMTSTREPSYVTK